MAIVINSDDSGDERDVCVSAYSSKPLTYAALRFMGVDPDEQYAAQMQIDNNKPLTNDMLQKLKVDPDEQNMAQMQIDSKKSLANDELQKLGVEPDEQIAAQAQMQLEFSESITNDAGSVAKALPERRGPRAPPDSDSLGVSAASTRACGLRRRVIGFQVPAPAPAADSASSSFQVPVAGTQERLHVPAAISILPMMESQSILAASSAIDDTAAAIK